MRLKVLNDGPCTRRLGVYASEQSMGVGQPEKRRCMVFDIGKSKIPRAIQSQVFSHLSVQTRIEWWETDIYHENLNHRYQRVANL